ELVLPAPLSVEQISLRDLLTHRSGIRNDAIALRTAYTGQTNNETILRLLANHSRVISPAYQYSNIGYIVAALVMEKAVKEPWKQILEMKIFVPLEMKNTSAFMSKAKRAAISPFRIFQRTAVLPNFRSKKTIRCTRRAEWFRARKIWRNGWFSI
ncbi:MAG TPA: serine hydrolase domain-containing protein, partial [Pyrinomonadaceae bacterium]|nr:serine hydrolase domain-containing protein [Pyrinomonadaceae bacterium]